jgi:hypothetical protein
MTTVRLSAEEVRVQSFIYGFDNPEVADQFQTCLLFDALEDCATKFPPLRQHSICFEIDALEPRT